MMSRELGVSWSLALSSEVDVRIASLCFSLINGAEWRAASRENATPNSTTTCPNEPIVSRTSTISSSSSRSIHLSVASSPPTLPPSPITAGSLVGRPARARQA